MRLVWKKNGPQEAQANPLNLSSIGIYASAETASTNPKNTAGRRDAPAVIRPSVSPHLGSTRTSAAATQSNASSTQINHAGPAGQFPSERHCCQNPARPECEGVVRYVG